MNTTISRYSVTEEDLTRIFLTLKDKHRNVFMERIGDQVFFYRSIGRKEYRMIIEDSDLNDLQKENVMCDVCVLWPENYDWNDCDAGIPGKLVEAIRKNSFLDTVESRQNLLSYYRSEMYDLDNQITCMIHEAFPQFDIEEIEAWDVEQTTKYLSRAEWILHQLRGLQYVEPQGQFSQASMSNQPVQQQQQQVVSQSVEQPAQRPIKNKKKLTPERIREMEEFARKFPQFAQDDVMNSGIDGMEQEDVSNIPPALRTPSQWTGQHKIEDAPQIDEKALAKLRAKKEARV